MTPEAVLFGLVTQLLRTTFANDAPELARLLPKLRNLIPDLPEPPKLAPAQARRHLFNSFCDFIVRLARKNPTLTIIEDLHWADDSTLAFLDHLTRRLSGVPLLVVATYRDAELDVAGRLAKSLENLVRGNAVTRVRLEGLLADEVALMLRSLSGQEPPAAVTSTIDRKSTRLNSSH